MPCAVTGTVGERLKFLRSCPDFGGFDTAKAFALAHGFKVATYTQHEAGSEVPLKAARRYAEAFGVTTRYIMFGDGED